MKNKVTIKDVREKAKAIKDRGYTGSRAFNKLKNYMRGFDNVFEMWGEPSIHRGQTYTPLSKIVDSGFFIKTRS